MADSVKTPDDAPKQLQQGKRPLQLIWSSLLLEGWLGPNPLFHFQNFSQSAVSLEGCGEAAVEMEVRQEGEITRWCIEAQPRSRVPGGATSASLFPSMAVATLLFTVLFLWAKKSGKICFSTEHQGALSHFCACLLREIVLGLYRVDQKPSWCGHLLSLHFDL